jgi:hypothetical protein
MASLGVDKPPSWSLDSLATFKRSKEKKKKKKKIIIIEWGLIFGVAQPPPYQP